jgi:hypothetical protein
MKNKEATDLKKVGFTQPNIEMDLMIVLLGELMLDSPILLLAF